MNSSPPNFLKNDTICAIATPSGTGAIAILRLSGNESLKTALKILEIL